MEPLFTAEINSNSKVSLFFGALFFLGLDCFLFYETFTSMGGLFALSLIISIPLLFLVGFIIWVILNKLNAYKIYSDRIEVYNILNRKKDDLNFSMIQSWTEYESSSKNGTYFYLTLYATGGHKIVINSSSLEGNDYQKIKDLVTAHAKEDKAQELNDSIGRARIYLVLLLITFLGFGYGSLKTRYSGLNQLGPGRFKTERFVLLKVPEIDYAKDDEHISLDVKYLGRNYSFDYKSGDADTELYSVINEMDSIESVTDDWPNDSTVDYSTTETDSDSAAQAVAIDSEAKTVTIKDYTFKATNFIMLGDSLRQGDSFYINHIYPEGNGLMRKLFGTNEPYLCGLWFSPKERYLKFNDFIAARKKSNTKTIYGLSIIGLIALIIAMAQLYFIVTNRKKLQEMSSQNAPLP